MRYKGRPKSANIDDRSSYFGTPALDPNYAFGDRTTDFLTNSLANPYPDAPQQFQRKPSLSIEQLIQNNDINRALETQMRAPGMREVAPPQPARQQLPVEGSIFSNLPGQAPRQRTAGLFDVIGPGNELIGTFRDPIKAKKAAEQFGAEVFEVDGDPDELEPEELSDDLF